MSMHTLLSEVAARGLELRVVGSELRLRPRSRVTAELVESLREHKTELLSHLSTADAESETNEIVDRVASMPLEEFARSGLVVRVFSEVLGSEVLFVADNVPARSLAGEPAPVYRVSELAKLALLRPGPAPLQQIHEVKTVFGGTIASVEPTGERPPETTKPGVDA